MQCFHLRLVGSVIPLLRPLPLLLPLPLVLPLPATGYRLRWNRLSAPKEPKERCNYELLPLVLPLPATGYRLRWNRLSAPKEPKERCNYELLPLVLPLPATGYAGTGYRRPKEPTGRCRAVQIQTSDRARGHVTLTLKLFPVHSFLGGSLHRIIVNQSNAS